MDLEVKFEHNITGTSLSSSRNYDFLEKVYFVLTLFAHYLEYKQMVTKTGQFYTAVTQSQIFPPDFGQFIMEIQNFNFLHLYFTER